MLEGGYGLGALARSVAATLAALTCPGARRQTLDGDGSPLVSQARERLARVVAGARLRGRFYSSTMDLSGSQAAFVVPPSLCDGSAALVVVPWRFLVV